MRFRKSLTRRNEDKDDTTEADGSKGNNLSLERVSNNVLLQAEIWRELFI